jgi:hypothetical protein
MLLTLKPRHSVCFSSPYLSGVCGGEEGFSRGWAGGARPTPSRCCRLGLATPHEPSSPGARCKGWGASRAEWAEDGEGSTHRGHRAGAANLRPATPYARSVIRQAICQAGARSIRSAEEGQGGQIPYVRHCRDVDLSPATPHEPSSPGACCGRRGWGHIGQRAEAGRADGGGQRAAGREVRGRYHRSPSRCC